MPSAMQALETLDETAGQFGVQVIGLYKALPDQEEFLIAGA